jgi:hypothetical protein
MRISVVLPHPDGPSRQVTELGGKRHGEVIDRDSVPEDTAQLFHANFGRHLTPFPDRYIDRLTAE